MFRPHMSHHQATRDHCTVQFVLRTLGHVVVVVVVFFVAFVVVVVVVVVVVNLFRRIFSSCLLAAVAL
jgi:hypothetical protein